MVPNGWERHLVGKICSSIVPGRNKPKSFGGDIAWVTVPEIKSRYIPSNIQENYVSEDVINECGGKIVPEGAVVMSAVGDLGLVAITKEQVVLNQQLHAFVCSPKIDNEYLAYWLVTQKPLMESIASRTTILYLNKSNCESIPVLVPPLPEQQKIAKILTTWDKAIDTTERLIDNSKQQKKALMQQLLTGKKRLLDDNGERFEGKWEEKSLSELGVVVTDGDRGKEYPKSSDLLTNGYCLFLSAKNVTKRGFVFDEIQFITKEKHEKLRKGVVNRGDIILTTRGTVGQTAYYDDSISYDCIRVNSGMVTLNCYKSSLESDFFYKVTNSSSFKQQIESLTFGSAQPQLTIKIIKALKVPTPSKREQQKIAAVLTNADKEIELLEQQLADLQQEKKALMQQLLTGKKRVLVDGGTA
ncbi:restriction endonuclease subunit S [Psychrobacter sp. KFRI-CH2-11]|uniref:restriction endonuclease subunit S n=1 Tax=Psychrobacter sp. KFRI-CH2-11 TaxID=3156079 RepID=UPI0032488DE1